MKLDSKVIAKKRLFKEYSHSMFFSQDKDENYYVNSPLVYFLNFCFVFLGVPFWTKWDPSKKRYILVYYKAQQFLCALYYFLVLHFHYFILVNNYLTSGEYESKESKGSPINAGFDIISFLGSHSFIHLFMKLAWFDPEQMEILVNSTCTFKKKPDKLSTFFFKFSIFGGFFIFLIIDYDYVKKIFILAKLSTRADYTCYKMVTRYFVLSGELGKWVWTVVQMHALNYNFVTHGFMLALSWSLREMAKEFEQDIMYATGNIRKVNIPKKIVNFKWKSDEYFYMHLGTLGNPSISSLTT